MLPRTTVVNVGVGVRALASFTVAMRPSMSYVVAAVLPSASACEVTWPHES